MVLCEQMILVELTSECHTQINPGDVFLFEVSIVSIPVWLFERESQKDTIIVLEQDTPTAIGDVSPGDFTLHW